MPCAVQQADVVFVGLQEVVALTPKGVMLPDEAKVYALYCLLLHRADRFQNGLDDGDQRSACRTEGPFRPATINVTCRHRRNTARAAKSALSHSRCVRVFKEGGLARGHNLPAPPLTRRSTDWARWDYWQQSVILSSLARC